MTFSSIDFLNKFPYTKNDIGGIKMNEFEQNVQCKRNDAIDSGVGFLVSFGFFTTIFIIGTVFQALA